MSGKNSAAFATATSADREIVITRVFDAPRELVWKAWTDPEHIVNWWGPRGFSLVVEVMDLRPGGRWKHTMHGPDGAEYPCNDVFTEVVKYERISYSHHGGKKGGPQSKFDATWTFEEQGEKTKVTLRMIFETAQEVDRVNKVFGALEGGKQTLSRLAEYLPTLGASVEAPPEDLILTREFNAPRELVWKAWTDPKQVAQWWGPNGYTNPVCELDARAGGAILKHMLAPGGTLYVINGEVKEADAPQRLVFIEKVSAEGDTKGEARTLLFELMNTITLKEHSGRTVMTVHTYAIRSSVEGAPYLAEMESDWTQMLERLERHVRQN